MLFRKRNVFLISLLLILSIAFLLRIYKLSGQSIWLDEARSIEKAEFSLGYLWNQRINDSSPAMYFLILHYWVKCFGRGEFQARFLSVIFSVLLPLLLFKVGSTIFNRKVGLYASLIAAISPYQIYYSQEIRMYSLLALISLVSFFLFYLSLKKGTLVYWSSYAVSTIICLYTHNYGLLLIFAEVCFYVFFYKKYQNALLKFLLSQLLISILSIPRVIALSQQPMVDSVYWISMAREGVLQNTFTYFSLLSYHLPKTPLVKTALIISIPIFVYLFIYSLLGIKRQRTKYKLTNIKREAYLLTLFYLFIPLLTAYLISFIKPIYVPGRYDILSYPAFCLIIALGLSDIKKTSLRTILLLGIILSTSLCLYTYYSIYRKSNDRLVANYIKTHAQKDDVLIFTGLSILSFRYYCSAGIFPYAFSFPDLEKDRGNLSKRAMEGEPRYVNYQIKKTKRKIYSHLGENNSLWIMDTPLVMNYSLLRDLQQKLRVEDKIELEPGDNFPQIQVHSIYIFKKLN